MSEENELVLAKTVFNDLCTMLEKREWSFQKYEEDLVVTFNATGEDIPMEFVIGVDAGRQLIRVLSRLPFTVPEDKRIDLAIAACVASNGLADGSFNYDIENGTIVFRLTASFRESRIGEGLLEYLIACSGMIVDAFNDKFFALCKGLISINDFIADNK